MVDFGTDYWHAMDKDKVEKINISPKEIGISLALGDPWANIQTAIKAGASHVELGFFGKDKGSISQPTGVTPEAITQEKRAEWKQRKTVPRRLAQHPWKKYPRRIALLKNSQKQ